jgi:hypothetical protein
MASKNNPGAFDCFGDAHPDEPLFVLRSTDVTAPFLVRAWQYLRAGQIDLAMAEMVDAAKALKVAGKKPKPLSDPKLAEARACAVAMFDWLHRAHPMSTDPKPPAARTKCYWCDGTGHSLGAAPDRGNPVCGKCDGTGVLPTPPATPRTPPAEIDRLKALRDEFGEKEAACKRAMEAAGSVQEIYAAAAWHELYQQCACAVHRLILKLEGTNPHA